MTEEQITLVKRSWKIFRSIDPAIIGDVFYSKLFLDNPRLRKLFPKSMEAQYRKLTDMLDSIISKLENTDRATSQIIALAERHLQYGARPEHYSMIGEALLWTLAHGLGKDWTEPVAQAWNTCYTDVAGSMINASNKALH